MPVIFYKNGNYEILNDKKIYSIVDIKNIIDEKFSYKGDYLIGFENNMVLFILENKNSKKKKKDEELNIEFYELFNIKVYGDVILFFGNELKLKDIVDLLINVEKNELLNKLNDELLKQMNNKKFPDAEFEDDIEDDVETYMMYDDVDLYLKRLKSTYLFINDDILFSDLIDFIYSDINNIVEVLFNQNEILIYKFQNTEIELIINKDNILNVLDYIINYYASKEDYDKCINIKNNIKKVIEILVK